MAIPYPPISKLPSLPARDLAKLLDQLFERAPALHTLSLPLLSSQTFDSYPALIAAVGSQLTSLFQSSSANDAAQLDDILAAHPRLGEKVDSEQSRYEQAQMNAHSGGDDEHERLRVANEDYERAFPGLRYVVFVNGRSRKVIMNDMRSRIERADIRREREDAIKAMCDIAIDRFSKST